MLRKIANVTVLLSFIILISFFALANESTPRATTSSATNAASSTISTDSTDLNSVFSFKKVFIEPATDNVDGALRILVDQAYKEVLSRNSRFELVDNSANADAVIKTRLEKTTSGLASEISIFVNKGQELFATDKVTVSATSDVEIRMGLKKLLRAALLRVPFYGTVTGRDGKELTFDIGSSHGLKVGDIVQIARIDKVKRHPLLKSIVDLQLVPIGSAVIDQVENSIAFGHVHQEIESQQITRLSKVTSIEGHILESVSDDKAKKKEALFEESTTDSGPQLGFLQASGYVSSFSDRATNTSTATTYSGSALNLGFRFTGELWITRNFFGDINYGLTTMSFGHNFESGTANTLNGASVTSGTNTSASTVNFSINFGYRHLLKGDIRGPQAFASLGYSAFKWDSTQDATTLLSPKGYTGFVIGLGGSIPLFEPQYGLMLKLNLIPFPSFSDPLFLPATSTDTSSATVIGLFFGGYYWLGVHIAVRAGIQYESYSANITGKAPASLSEKQIGFLPSFLYYF